MASCQQYEGQTQGQEILAVKVLCKAKSGYALGIKDDKAQLVSNDPRDPNQQWRKVPKDSKAFVIVNNGTDKAICQPLVPGQQVSLEDYKPGSFEQRLLWSECGNTNDGFRAISEENNTNLILDADQSGQRITVTAVVPELLAPKENQLWKISPQIVTVSCKAKPGYALGIQDDKAQLVPNDPSAQTQQWLKVWKANSQAFVLVNNDTDQAICHPLAPGLQVSLVDYTVGCFDDRLLWSECGNATDEFRAVSEANNPNLILDADQSGQRITDTVRVVAKTPSVKESQLWKISLCD